MPPEPRPDTGATPDAHGILASGLLDRDWVAAQLGTELGTDGEALERFLDPGTNCSPHPLFEESWAGRSL